MRLAVLLAFAVALLLDVAGTVLLGTGGRPERIVELLRLHFLLGESCIDLLALAAARGLLLPLVLLAGLRANRLRKVATAPSAESPPPSVGVGSPVSDVVRVDSSIHRSGQAYR